MSSGTTIQIGVWGLGSHAVRNVLPAIAKASFGDLVAVHTRNDLTLREVAGNFGARAHSHPDDLLADPDVAAVYLSTPTGLHAAMAERVIAAGKHLLCEKPLTDQHQATAGLVASARRRELIVLEADMFLHHPQFRRLQDLVQAGSVGQLASLTARFGFPHRGVDDFRYSRDLGGGALLDAGFYPVAAAVGLMGPGLEIAGSTLISAPSFEVDTGGTALAVAGHRGAILDWGFGRSYRSELNVWCEGGVIEVSRAFSKPADLETQIIVRHQSGQETIHPVPAADHFELMLDHFSAVVAGDETYDPEPILVRSRLLQGIRVAAS